MGSMPRVAVVGGSLGGLTAALVLKDLGCEVSVYERSHHELEARGAGIAVLEATWRYPVQRLGVPADEFSSKTRYVRFLESDGSITYEEPRAYHLSSWNAVYRVLLHGFGRERYHLSSEMTTFVDDGEHVTVSFADGRIEVVDLLVCADGITSEARQTLLPEVASDYAGYVAWRGVIPESELSAATFDALHESLTYQVMENSHILVYPIPGLAGEVEGEDPGLGAEVTREEDPSAGDDRGEFFLLGPENGLGNLCPQSCCALAFDAQTLDGGTQLNANV